MAVLPGLRKGGCIHGGLACSYSIKTCGKNILQLGYLNWICQMIYLPIGLIDNRTYPPVSALFVPLPGVERGRKSTQGTS